MSFRLPAFRPCLLALLTLLAGCGADPCMDADLQDASQGSYFADGRIEQPFNQWSSNPKLATLIEKVIRVDGIGALEARYAFRCSPHPAQQGCGECRLCTATIRQTTLQHRVITPACYNTGEMLVHAEIGRGGAVRAISYWKYDGKR